MGGDLRGGPGTPPARRTGSVTTPLVSIVLPTRNGAATLPAVFEAIMRQRVEFPFEIVAVDSGSSDGTADWLHGRADRLISIGADAFDHGLTRNLGIENARGELIVLLVQDALPASGRWLAELTRPLLEDGSIAGAYARQAPRPDASAVTRYYLERYAATSETPRTSAVPSPEGFMALSPIERVLACTFDNVCSCIRRSVWRAIPFPETPIAEDVEWARAVLLAGHRLQYVPAATVIHSHERSARYELYRTYLVHRRLRALFGLATIPTVGHLVRAIASTLRVHTRCLAGPSGPRSRPAEVLRTLSLAVALPLGQYLGARAADTGRDLLRPTGV